MRTFNVPPFGSQPFIPACDLLATRLQYGHSCSCRLHRDDRGSRFPNSHAKAPRNYHFFAAFPLRSEASDSIPRPWFRLTLSLSRASLLMIPTNTECCVERKLLLSTESQSPGRDWGYGPELFILYSLISTPESLRGVTHQRPKNGHPDPAQERKGSNVDGQTFC